MMPQVKSSAYGVWRDGEALSLLEMTNDEFNDLVNSADRTPFGYRNCHSASSQDVRHEGKSQIVTVDFEILNKVRGARWTRTSGCKL
jgi:hypothetical protein